MKNKVKNKRYSKKLILSLSFALMLVSFNAQSVSATTEVHTRNDSKIVDIYKTEYDTEEEFLKALQDASNNPSVEDVYAYYDFKTVEKENYKLPEKQGDGKEKIHYCLDLYEDDYATEKEYLDAVDRANDNLSYNRILRYSSGITRDDVKEERLEIEQLQNEPEVEDPSYKENVVFYRDDYATDEEYYTAVNDALEDDSITVLEYPSENGEFLLDGGGEAYETYLKNTGNKESTKPFGISNDEYKTGELTVADVPVAKLYATDSDTEEELAQDIYNQFNPGEDGYVTVITTTDVNETPQRGFIESVVDRSNYTIRNIKTINNETYDVLDSDTGKPGDTLSVKVYNSPINSNVPYWYYKGKNRVYNMLNSDKESSTTTWIVPETNEGKKVKSATLYTYPVDNTEEFDLYKQDDNGKWQKVDTYTVPKAISQTVTDHKFTYE